MSRLFPERFRLALGRDYLLLAQVSGQRVRRLEQYAVDNTWGSAVNSIRLPLLRSWLSQHLKQGARVEVVLSADLAPLQLLPWQEGITDATQQSLLARHRLRLSHPQVEHWQCRVHPGAYGQPWLAVGVDGVLLDGLRDMLSALGAGLTSVQALSLSLYRELRVSLPAHGWLLVREPHHSTLLHWQQGDWQLLQHLPNSELSGLHEVLLRERRLAGLDTDGLDDMASVHSIQSPPLTAVPGVHLRTVSWHWQGSLNPGYGLHLLGGR